MCIRDRLNIATLKCRTRPGARRGAQNCPHQALLSCGQSSAAAVVTARVAAVPPHPQVTGGPGEDVAEAVMGFVNARAVLQARSPVRFGFLDSHRASWLPFLRTRPPVGDFLGPSGPGRLA